MDHAIFDCPDCEARVSGEVLAQYDCHVDDPESGPWDLYYFLVKCPQCTQPALLRIVEDGDPGRIWPPLDRLDWEVPAPIREAYDEAARCFDAGAFTAAAVMCRKVLEGVCNEQGARSGSLASRLDDLKAKGVVDSRLADWANQLRLGGNEAAHDPGVTVDRADARDLKDFTKAIVEYMFTIQKRFDAFQQRREARAAKAREP